MNKQLVDLQKHRVFATLFIPVLDKKKRTITVALPCVEDPLEPGHASGRLHRKYSVDVELEKKLLLAGFKKDTMSCGGNGYKIYYVLRY